MAMNSLPSSLQAVIQQGFLERHFEESLRAKLGYRAIADREPFMAGIGETVTKTRPGLLPTITTPIATPAVTDITSGLTPQSYSVEQYVLQVQQYAASMMLNVATSQVAIDSLFLRNASNLAEQAMRSVDGFAASALFSAYMGGNTRVRTTLGAPATTLAVDDIRGFQFVPNALGQLVPVSTGSPMTVTIGAGAYSVTNVNVDSTNVSTAAGPAGGISGVLTLSSNVSVSDGTANNSVISSIAPVIIRPSPSTGGAMVTNTSLISASANVNQGRLTLQMILAAKSQLEANGVKPVDETGRYHVYVEPNHIVGLYADPAFQMFFRGQINSEEYRKGVIADTLGVQVIETNLNPVQNLSGVGAVRRAVLVGQGALVEGTFTQVGYEAANQVDDGNLTTVVDGIAHITREPIDTLKQVVTQTWSYIGGFVAPTDITTNPATIPTASNAGWKRAAIIESL